MKPALAHVSTLNAQFPQEIEDYAAGQCQAMELWFGKLEVYLDQHPIEKLRELLEQRSMAVPVASFQGGLLASQGEARKEAWDLFARRLETCRSLGVETIVVAADVNGPMNAEDLERVRFSLREAARMAGEAGLRLALEPQAKATFCNNLETAAALIAETGSPHLGICFDAFHFYTGPSKLEDLAWVNGDNLFHVQLCDMAGTVREFASDSDRVLPGDGDYQLTPIIDHLRSINYPGYVSIELMNPQVWQIAPLAFGEIAMTALRKVLNLASMGSEGHQAKK